MNLEELRNTLASDATKENERLKTEINLLREHLRDAMSDDQKIKVAKKMMKESNNA